jgi:hypothetical protein
VNDLLPDRLGLGAWHARVVDRDGAEAVLTIMLPGED